MKKLSQDAETLLVKARKSRFPSPNQLVLAKESIWEQLEGHNPSKTFARPFSFALVLVILLIASTGTAFSALYVAARQGWISTGPEESVVEPSENRENNQDRAEKTRPRIRPQSIPEHIPEDEEEQDTEETPSIVETKATHSPLQKKRSVVERHFSEPEVSSQIERDLLVEESKLIGSADRAIRDRDPHRALSILEEHSRRFPHGKLRNERRAAGLIARCQLNPTDALRDRAKRYLSNNPRSLFTSRVRSECLKRTSH